MPAVVKAGVVPVYQVEKYFKNATSGIEYELWESMDKPLSTTQRTTMAVRLPLK